MKSKTILKWKMPVVKGVERKTEQALVKMGYDIVGWAKINAPVQTGALRNSIRVSDMGEKVTVSAGGAVGGKLIDYALKREVGPNRNPATVGYMSKSFEKVTAGDWQKKYFGGITK